MPIRVFLRPIQTKRKESLTQSLRNLFTTRTTKRRRSQKRDPSRAADKRSEDARIVSVCCVWQPDAMGRARGRTVTAPHSPRLRPRRQLDPSQNRLVLWCFGAQKQPRMSRRRGQEAKASIEHKARSARPKNPYSFEVFQTSRTGRRLVQRRLALLSNVRTHRKGSRASIRSSHPIIRSIVPRGLCCDSARRGGAARLVCNAQPVLRRKSEFSKAH